MEYIALAAFVGLLVVIFLLNKDDEPKPDRAKRYANLMDPRAWEIGPINDRLHNFSLGYDPPVPDAHPEGFAFPISPAHEPHYVTARYGSLTGKTRLVLRGRIECAPDVIIHGADATVPINQPGSLTLYFEQPDEDGTRNFSDEGHRWYAPLFALLYLTGRYETGAFTYELVAPLDGPWTSVSAMTRENNPQRFAEAIAKADRVGFVFGNHTGYGHGVSATGPVRFIVTYFGVE